MAGTNSKSIVKKTKLLSRRVTLVVILIGIILTVLSSSIVVRYRGEQSALRERTQVTLTVLVDEERVAEVQLYLGVPKGMKTDFRTQQAIFPHAELVEQRTIMLTNKELENLINSYWAGHYVKFVFALKPGHYFVYPVTRNPNISLFQPVEVQLTNDTEIRADTLVPL